uniref:Uncharacterized protein n=1 Tax=Oryza barthii TaxID=65489 RepID=A0A0D3F081_9ORYZ
MAMDGDGHEGHGHGLISDGLLWLAIARCCKSTCMEPIQGCFLSRQIQFKFQAHEETVWLFKSVHTQIVVTGEW